MPSVPRLAEVTVTSAVKLGNRASEFSTHVTSVTEITRSHTGPAGASVLASSSSLTIGGVPLAGVESGSSWSAATTWA